MVLGLVVPSNGARAGGVIFPVVKGLAEAYDSTPGPTATRLGTFLMLMVYHCDMTVSAMFFTGNAANPLIASLAKQTTGIEISYWQWALGAIVPALASMVAIPMLMYAVRPPTIKRTPGAAALAAEELVRLGPMSRAEKVMLAVFALTTTLYATRSWHGVDYSVSALIGLVALLLGGVLTWDDVLAERSAWDSFIWYGAIYQMARALGEAGISQVFARSVAGLTPGAVVVGGAADSVGGLPVRALRVCDHHGSRLCALRPVPRRHARRRRARLPGGALDELSLRARLVADALRDDDVADLLRRRLSRSRRLVAHRTVGGDRQCDRMDGGRRRVVEDPGLVVSRALPITANPRIVCRCDRA